MNFIEFKPKFLLCSKLHTKHWGKKTVKKKTTPHISTGSYIKLVTKVNDRVRPNCLSLNLFHIFSLFRFRQTFSWTTTRIWNILLRLNEWNRNVCWNRTLQNVDDFFFPIGASYLKLYWIETRRFQWKINQSDCKNECEYAYLRYWLQKSLSKAIQMKSFQWPRSKIEFYIHWRHKYTCIHFQKNVVDLIWIE